MDIAIFITIIFLVGWVLFILPIMIGYKLWRKGKYTKYIVITLLAGYFYLCFRAFYPEDSFFVAHLEQFTGVKFQEGIHVIKKSAGYPDLHGDYPACAVMKLTEKDIAALALAITDGYEKIEPNEFSGSCLNSMEIKLEHLYYKEAPGELIYWGYNSKTLEAYFDYYSH